MIQDPSQFISTDHSGGTGIPGGTGHSGGMCRSGHTMHTGTVDLSGTIHSGMILSGDLGEEECIGDMIPGMVPGGRIILAGIPTDQDPGIRTDRFIPDIMCLSRPIRPVFPAEGT